LLPCCWFLLAKLPSRQTQWPHRAAKWGPPCPHWHHATSSLQPPKPRPALHSSMPKPLSHSGRLSMKWDGPSRPLSSQLTTVLPVASSMERLNRNTPSQLTCISIGSKITSRMASSSSNGSLVFAIFPTTTQSTLDLPFTGARALCASMNPTLQRPTSTKTGNCWLTQPMLSLLCQPSSVRVC